MVVGLVAARDVEMSVPPSRAVPCRARRARSRRCDVYMSACKCQSVQWSCLCSAVEMCDGVCTVGACACVLARACARVLRRRCRMSLPAPETARPFPSCRTTGRSPRARGHPPWWAIHRSFFLLSHTVLIHATRSGRSRSTVSTYCSSYRTHVQLYLASTRLPRMEAHQPWKKTLNTPSPRSAWVRLGTRWTPKCCAAHGAARI